MYSRGWLAFFVIVALWVFVASGCGEAAEEDLPPEGASAPAITPVPPEGASAPLATPAAPAALSGTVANTFATPSGEPVSDHFIVTSLGKATTANGEYSPDGASSFLITSDGLIVTYGGIQRNVQSKVVDARWAPDSRSLAVVVTDAPLTTMREELPVYVINADGSEKQVIAKTTVPAALQFLPDGTLAYQNGAQLHMVDPATGEDQVAASGLDTEPENGLPYRLSPDGAAVALMRGTTLSVLDFASGSVTDLTTTVDFRRWGSYAWWSRDVLVYSDTGPKGLEAAPRIFSFDRKSGTQTQLLSGIRRGAYADLTPTSSGGWLLYVYRDTGNQVEPGALYEAVNLYSGQQFALFKWGLGLDLDERAGEIRFLRSVGSPGDIGPYVATVSY